MKDVRSMDRGKWYRSRDPATLARRLYGNSVELRLEHNPVHRPTYRIWMVIGKNGVVRDRLYEPIVDATDGTGTGRMSE